MICFRFNKSNIACFQGYLSTHKTTTGVETVAWRPRVFLFNPQGLSIADLQCLHSMAVETGRKENWSYAAV